MGSPQKAVHPKEPLDQIEEHIRAGQTRMARDLLGGIPTRLLAPNQRFLYARLSWRCGAAHLGVRLLFSSVRGTARHALTPTAEETAEYGMCLAKLGGHGEALELLRGIRPEDYARAEFYSALALVGTWDYSASIPLLKQYLRREAITDYDRLAARLNLAAALIFEKRYWESDGILRRLLHDCSYHDWRLLKGNVAEVYGMSLVWRRQWLRGEALLRQAEAALRDTDSFDELLVRKGLAAIELFKKPDSALADEKMKTLREEAVRRRHWNTLRECDRMTAIATGDRSLAAKVAFGTPSEAYRARIVKDTGLVPDSTYLWRLGDADGERNRTTRESLDVALGIWKKDGASLKPGSAPHRLLAALASDFFRPIPVATLFQRVFTDELYSPAHAPARIHQSVKLLRAWLRQRRSGIEIAFEEDGYRLTAQKAVQIRVPWQLAAESREDWALNRLRAAFGTHSFSASEVSSLLKVSPRSSQLLLSAALARDLVQRKGARRGARYLFR